MRGEKIVLLTLQRPNSTRRIDETTFRHETSVFSSRNKMRKSRRKRSNEISPKKIRVVDQIVVIVGEGAGLGDIRVAVIEQRRTGERGHERREEEREEKCVKNSQSTATFTIFLSVSMLKPLQIQTNHD